jgi:hypothetical protein
MAFFIVTIALSSSLIGWRRFEMTVPELSHSLRQQKDLRRTKSETKIPSWLKARIAMFSSAPCVMLCCCDGTCPEWAYPPSKGFVPFVLYVLYLSKTRLIVSFMQITVIHSCEIQFLDLEIKFSEFYRRLFVLLAAVCYVLRKKFVKFWGIMLTALEE